MRYVVGFLRFWYDFVVGDDWRIAAGAVLVLAAGAVVVALDFAGPWLPPVLLGGLVVVFAVPLLRSMGPGPR
jgi:hypothetical protein